MARSDNTKAALLMMGSMAAFTLGDTFIKMLGESLPLSQIIVLRGIVATVFIYALAKHFGQWRLNLSRAQWGAIGLRSLTDVGAAYFFLNALLNMPLANATSILQMLPLTVTLASALFLREAVGWRRWTAIAFGFLGMLLIMQPGAEGFNSYTLYALAAVACVTARDIVTRLMPADVPSLTVTFCNSVAVLGLGLVLTLGQSWTAVSGREALILLTASLCITAAYACAVLTMRVGEVSASAPFRYTSIVFALILGFVAFGDWPDALTLTGAAIIVASGLFTMWRAQAKTRRM